MENVKEPCPEEQFGVLDLLYEQYQESVDGDSFLGKLLFHQLYAELRMLDTDTSDRIISTVCALCSDYENEAYVAGIKAGVQLCREVGLCAP